MRGIILEELYMGLLAAGQGLGFRLCMYPRNCVGVSFNSDTVWWQESVAKRIPGGSKLNRLQFLYAWYVRGSFLFLLGLSPGLWDSLLGREETSRGRCWTFHVDVCWGD